MSVDTATEGARGFYAVEPKVGIVTTTKRDGHTDAELAATRKFIGCHAFEYGGDELMKVEALAECDHIEAALAESRAEVSRLTETLRFIANAKVDHLTSGQQHLLSSLIVPAKTALTPREAS